MKSLTVLKFEELYLPKRHMPEIQYL